MINQVVLKLNRSCNLRCTYCYYINDDTEDFGDRLKLSILKDFLIKYFNYCEKHDIIGHLAFHGGEPLIMGLKYYQEIFNIPQINYSRFRFSLQTNGLRLNEDYIKIFKENKVHIGISLDGPKKINDKYRVKKNGKGSFDQVVESIKLLHKNEVYPSILTVIQEESNAQEIIDCMRNLGVKSLDLLPPIYNHLTVKNSPNIIKITNKVILESFYIWLNIISSDKYEDENFKIRLFESLLLKHRKKIKGYSPIGTELLDTFFVLETNGEVALLEELEDIDRIDGVKRYRTNLFIQNASFEKIEIAIKAFWNDKKKMPTICSTCDMNDICNGGSYGTRFDENFSFDNPSIYCGTFYSLSKYMKQITDTKIYV